MIQKLKMWILKKVIERRIKKMLTGIAEKLQGKKTYVLAVVGILVGLVGVLFGPVDVAGLTIPALTWNEFFKIVWESGLFAFLRMGVTK